MSIEITRLGSPVVSGDIDVKSLRKKKGWKGAQKLKRKNTRLLVCRLAFQEEE